MSEDPRCPSGANFIYSTPRSASTPSLSRRPLTGTTPLKMDRGRDSDWVRPCACEELSPPAAIAFGSPLRERLSRTLPIVPPFRASYELAEIGAAVNDSPNRKACGRPREAFDVSRGTPPGPRQRHVQ
jgi:hypothetical protein